ncbi:MAG: hypothetical protein DRP02_02250 [Candidatus Gerdarchaeota archaeon]|nr:MAG: hypothetical protein DRP02_02250 [Candidatus Gerdarchaeota archaeon]
MTYESNTHDNEDTVDIEVLYAQMEIARKEGKSKKQIAEKLDCSLRAVEEGFAFNKKLYS